MTCPRNGVINYPRKIVRSRQGQAVITRAAITGSPLTSLLVANGAQESSSFTVSKCISKRCLTCPKFIVSKTFISNLTRKSILLSITLGKTFHVSIII